MNCLKYFFSYFRFIKTFLALIIFQWFFFVSLAWNFGKCCFPTSFSKMTSASIQAFMVLVVWDHGLSDVGSRLSLAENLFLIFWFIYFGYYDKTPLAALTTQCTATSDSHVSEVVFEHCLSFCQHPSPTWSATSIPASLLRLFSWELAMFFRNCIDPSNGRPLRGTATQLLLSKVNRLLWISSGICQRRSTNQRRSSVATFYDDVNFNRGFLENL